MYTLSTVQPGTAMTVNGLSNVKDYLTWGLCPQTPGIFLEWIITAQGDISKLPKRGHFYFALTL
jgi:hypothetical protein